MSKKPGNKPTSTPIGSTLMSMSQDKSTYGITTSSKNRGGNNVNVGVYCCCCTRGGGSASLTMMEYIEEEVVL